MSNNPNYNYDYTPTRKREKVGPPGGFINLNEDLNGAIYGKIYDMQKDSITLVELKNCIDELSTIKNKTERIEKIIETFSDAFYKAKGKNDLRVNSKRPQFLPIVRCAQPFCEIVGDYEEGDPECLKGITEKCKRNVETLKDVKQLQEIKTKREI